MGMIVDRKTFETLIDGDLKWLENIMKEHDPHSLECKHIVDCLKMMPELLYEHYYVKA